MVSMVEVQKAEAENSIKVPVIDFSELSDPTARFAICAQVARACETVGFFEIKNHGIPREMLNEAFDISRDFFDQSIQEKMNYHPVLKQKLLVPVFQLGYKRFPVIAGIENRLEEMVFRDHHMREGKEEFYTNGDKSQEDIDPKLNWWPTNPPDYQQNVKSLLANLGRVGDTLLDVFSESLGLPRTYLRMEHHKNATAPRYLNFHHYPQGTKPNVDEIGIIPHRDSSVFTIVCQGYDTQGLQINPYGQWVRVVPQRGSLIVNVGDVLQAWTNGRYRSILHRVLSNREEGRHSFAYFCYPAPPEEDFIVQPISKLISEENPAAYVPFSYLGFFKNKMLVNSQTSLQTHEVEVN